MKERIYRLIEKGSHGNKANLVFDYFIMSLILLNIIAVILETFPDIKSRYAGFLYYFEVFSVVIFSIEYLMRLYIADLTFPSNSRLKSRLKFIFSFYGLIDLMAILPFYLPFFMTVDLRFLRILRFMRFLRILKINRYNNSLNLIGAVLKDKRTELGITFFGTFLILSIFTFLLYYVEKEHQPESIPNILHVFWWSLGTITKIRYVDIYPVTDIGRIVIGLLAFLGIALIAIPTGIISSGFIARLRSEGKQVKCPNCGKIIKE